MPSNSNYNYIQQNGINKIEFPEESFLIAGISFYKDNCLDITYESELTMELEPENKYDSSAIVIKNNGKIIGYVPNTPKSKIKELCKEKINEPLKILNIKMIHGNYGIRVISKSFYEYDSVLQSMVFFADK